jgi:lipid-binding SYLF domain-containing protein
LLRSPPAVHFFNPASQFASAGGHNSSTQGQRIRGTWRGCGKEKLNMKKAIASVCLSLLFSATAFAASSREDLQDRMDAARVVLDQIMRANDRTVPSNILKSATCVAVVPGMVKGAFIVGAQYGQGVVTCRTGHGWSAPVFIRMAGGSFGFQIGGQATDLILIAVNDRGFQDLLKDKFKIGGDASAAAGPVGRAGTASTDWKMNAELLSYSRAKGLFAGIDLDGTSVSQNRDDTEIYYGEPLHFEAILHGDVPVPPGAVDFVRAVANYFVRARADAN